MKNHFTISEFAHLRNININSLRYYEKIGLLKPAIIDPQTKYRYYAPEQLSELDTIQLCIALGVPLKQLISYIDENGYVQYRKLLEDGRKLAEEKRKEIQTGLNKIEYSLRYLDDNRLYQNQQGTYVREIGARSLITAEYIGDIRNLQKIEQLSSELYSYAQMNHMSPVLPTGVIVQCRGEIKKYFVFFEIAGEDNNDAGIIKIPKSKFLCMQTDITAKMDILKILHTNFGEEQNLTVIVSNMISEKFRFGSKRSELQKLEIENLPI